MGLWFYLVNAGTRDSASKPNDKEGEREVDEVEGDAASHRKRVWRGEVRPGLNG